MYRRPKFAYGRSWRWSRQTFSEKFNLIRCDFVQSFHKIFRLILMYHQTEFGSKWNRWEYMVMWWLYEPPLWSWPWREQSNHFVRHTGSWWGITILNLVTKGSEVQTISSGQRLNEILNLLCDLDLEQSNQILSQDTLTYNDAQRNTKLFGCEKDQQFRRHSRNNRCLINMSALWPWPWICNTHFFFMTLRLMMMHHHTNQGHKRFRSSEDTVRTKSGHTDTVVNPIT